MVPRVSGIWEESIQLYAPASLASGERFQITYWLEYCVGPVALRDFCTRKPVFRRMEFKLHSSTRQRSLCDDRVTDGNHNAASCSLIITYLLTYSLTPWSRVLLEKLTGFQLVKKFPAFMEPESSLPHSQMPAICPYPEPARYIPYPPHIPLPEDPS